MTESILSVERPLPHPSPLSERFWQAMARHSVLIQRCRSCLTFTHPPLPVCPVCHSTDLGWDKTPMTGTVYSYTVVHRPPTSDFAPAVPYHVALVDLDDVSVRLLSNVAGPDLDLLGVGARVRIAFDPGDTEVGLFHFELLPEEG